MRKKYYESNYGIAGTVAGIFEPAGTMLMLNAAYDAIGGTEAAGVSANQGAESTVSFLSLNKAWG